VEEHPVTMASLVEFVRRRVSSGPLDRVEAARALAEDLNSDADELVGHFIDEARRDGQSWTAIGERLGVSKQAARQRFGEAAGLRTIGGLRLMPRLQTCLEAAEREAMNDGSPEIGTQHQLIGLFQEGVASATLEKLGLRVDAVRATAHDLFPPADPSGQSPPSSAEAREGLDRAARLASRARCNYVGTEHLLFAIALDPGSRARRVLTRLDANLAEIKKELACFVEGPKKRRRGRVRERPSAPRSAAEEGVVPRLVRHSASHDLSNRGPSTLRC
jgi:Clp amino terminal domain, pathogenicity island component